MSAPIISVAAPATDRGAPNYQQDRAVARADLLAVFDGHGTYGEEAAISVANTFAAAPSAAAFHTLFADAHNACRDALRTHFTARGVAFTETGGAFYNRPAFSYYLATPLTGGTTATAVRIDPATGAMTAAHVGDSEAMYFDADDAPGVTLCVGDHTPTSLAEFRRIRALPSPTVPAAHVFGGSAQTRHIFVPDGAGDWRFNPAGGFQYADVRHSWAAYIQHGTDRLAMTRALGDFNLHRAGLITTPDVTSVAAPAAGVTRAVVVASDGLWDAVHYDEVRAVVRRADLLGNAAAATAAVLDLGIRMSKARFGGHAAHDNITVVVAYITTPAVVATPAVPEPVHEVLVAAAAAAAIASMAPSSPPTLLTPAGRGGYRRRADRRQAVRRHGGHNTRGRRTHKH